MARSIEFRAWTGKQMLYQGNQYLGSFIRRVVMQVMLDRATDEPRDHESYLPAGTSIDDYLQQFTGCKDANGKKIYDGDICFLEDSPRQYYVVYWKKDRWGLKHGEVSDLYEIDWGRWEVIGNIRENPNMFQVAA